METMIERDYEKVVASVTVKATGDDRRVTVGILTVGTPDSDNEIVDQATAMLAMPRFMAAGAPVLLDHDRAAGIGRCIEYTGLRANGQATMVPEETMAIQVTTEYGKGYEFPTLFYGPLQVDDVWARISQKMLATHSIAFRGYTARSAESDAENAGALRIFVRRVLEYSSLLIPAHEGAHMAPKEAALANQLMKAAGLQHCAECRTKLAGKLTEWTRRFPEAQAREVVDRARELAEQSSPVSTPAMLDLAQGIRDLARLFAPKEQ